MHTLLKTKIGPFLVISSVLAVWTLLAVQPVQAHSLPNPSCSGLPTADDFFGADTAGGTAALSSPASAGGSSNRTHLSCQRKEPVSPLSGNTNYLLRQDYSPPTDRRGTGGV